MSLMAPNGADLNVPRASAIKRQSVFIGKCMIDVDWDDNGMIDYEEFLRALHPRFNEAPVTPKAMKALSPGKMKENNFIFRQSVQAVTSLSVSSPVDEEDEKDETAKKGFEVYMSKKQQKSHQNALGLKDRSQSSQQVDQNAQDWEAEASQSSEQIARTVPKQ